MTEDAMFKMIVLCGPTATGKTKLAIEMAKTFKGEIVNADSRQVYKGMDVGTGKDIGNIKYQIANIKSISNDQFQIGYYEVDEVKVWLLDIVEPDYRFNVADYKKCADVVIKDILDRGKLPIIVGGTGFYMKAIIDGIETIGVAPDWNLRDELQSCKVSELQSILGDLDPKRSQKMNESDRQNPRRLIRAIEIAKNSKQNAKLKTLDSKFNTLFVGLTAPFSILYQRIDQRVEERVKNGLEDEIKDLFTKGYNFENSVLGTTLAYSEWQAFFEQNKNKEAIIQKWKYDEHNYARRQMTWFKKDKRINWFDITQANWKSELENQIRSWYI